uniref:Dolichol phosphate-mannose biosynthesis regulatory protein n=1 Tax=Glossina palpalis gambiensis TaxID=67801 RepID=A0A1B0B188_9MUSC
MASDANVGKIVFVIAVSVFLYYFFWVSILPFMLIDEALFNSCAFRARFQSSCWLRILKMQWLVIGISGVTCGGKTTLARSLRDYFTSQRNSPLWNTSFIINDVQLISQDDYFLPVDDLRHKWVEKLNVINFELLSSLDMKQMLSDITWTMKGRYLAGDPVENINNVTDISAQNCAGSSNLDRFTTQSKPSYHNNYGAGQHSQHVCKMLLNHKLPHHYHTINNSQAAHIMRINSQLPGQLGDTRINILLIEGFIIFNQPELLTLCNVKFHFHLPYEKCFERRRKRTYDPPDVTGYFEICVWPHYEKSFTEFRDRKDIIILNGEVDKDKIFKYALRRIFQYVEERCDGACPPPHKLLGIPSFNSNGNVTAMKTTCPMEQQ